MRSDLTLEETAWISQLLVTKRKLNLWLTCTRPGSMFFEMTLSSRSVIYIIIRTAQLVTSRLPVDVLWSSREKKRKEKSERVEWEETRLKKERESNWTKVDKSFYGKKLSVQCKAYILVILFETAGDCCNPYILSNHDLSFLAIPWYTRPYLRHDEIDAVGAAFTFEWKWRNVVPKGCSVNADNNVRVSVSRSC